MSPMTPDELDARVEAVTEALWAHRSFSGSVHQAEVLAAIAVAALDALDGEA